MQNQGLKALVYGSTGAVGSELVSILLASPNWQTVTCVVRKRLEAWEKLQGKQKLRLEIHQDLDDYFKQDNNKYGGYDCVFTCFGSQVKHGQETFTKVDKTYPLLAADIANRNKIPHYVLVSSRGGDSKSWFLYLRIKGEVEEQLKMKKLNLLSITKPGLLKNRKDARTGQKVFGVCPCVPKIQARQCADSLRLIAQKYHAQSFSLKEKVNVYQNPDLLDIVAN